jgi:pimeloyl-ACP methyl ester carboxylesterase
MSTPPKNAIVLGSALYDLAHRVLTDQNGARLELRPKSAAVLDLLVVHANQLVSKDSILASVWNGRWVTEDSLVRCAHEIREMLGDTEHLVLRTESGRGYRLLTTPDDTHLAELSHEGEKFEQQIRFARAPDGVQLAFGVSGSGAPLVRAPVWMTHLDWDWRSLAIGAWQRRPGLRHTFVRFDYRGTGLSQRGVAIDSLEQQVGDMKAVVDAAGLERFAIRGSIGGGPIAIKFAACYPDRVTHLVLVGSGARGMRACGHLSMPEPEFSALNELILRGWGSESDAYRQIITSTLFPDASADQMRSFNHLQRVSASPIDAVHLHTAISLYDASSDLPKVRCPTLVFKSSQDQGWLSEEMSYTVARLRNATVHLMDTNNYLPLANETAFERTHQIIDSFLSARPLS